MLQIKIGEPYFLLMNKILDQEITGSGITQYYANSLNSLDCIEKLKQILLVSKDEVYGTQL